MRPAKYFIATLLLIAVLYNIGACCDQKDISGLSQQQRDEVVSRLQSVYVVSYVYHTQKRPNNEPGYGYIEVADGFDLDTVRETAIVNENKLHAPSDSIRSLSILSVSELPRRQE